MIAERGEGVKEDSCFVGDLGLGELMEDSAELLAMDLAETLLARDRALPDWDL